MNAWAVVLVRHSRPFLKRVREELKQMEQRKSKLMTTNQVMHPSEDVDRLYVSTKGGGR